MNLLEKEKIVKGFANHYRIRVLELLETQQNLSLENIVTELRANYKTISVHVRKLDRAELIEKRYYANYVLHNITKRGLSILTFLRKLE